MARLKINHPLLLGISGAFGDLVFRTVGKKTIVCKKPDPKKKSAKQLEHQRTFGAAQNYARSAMMNPEVRQEYEQIASYSNLLNAHLAAVTDYLSNPKLKWLYEVTIVPERPPILIEFQNNYKCKTVFVEVFGKDGTLLECGNASFTFGDKYWNYHRSNFKPSAKVRITVTDRLGRVTKFNSEIDKTF